MPGGQIFHPQAWFLEIWHGLTCFSSKQLIHIAWAHVGKSNQASCRNSHFTTKQLVSSRHVCRSPSSWQVSGSHILNPDETKSNTSSTLQDDLGHDVSPYVILIRASNLYVGPDSSTLPVSAVARAWPCTQHASMSLNL